MLLRFIFVASISSFFIFVTEWCFITWTYLNLTYIHHLNICVLSSVEMWWIKCNEASCSRLYMDICFSFSPEHLELEWIEHIVVYANVLKQRLRYFPKWLYHLPLPPIGYESFKPCYTSPTLDIVRLFNFSHSYDFNLQLSNSKDTEYLFMCLHDILYLLWKFSFRYFANLYLGCVFLLLSCESFFLIHKNIHPWSDLCFTNIFFQLLACVLIHLFQREDFSFHEVFLVYIFLMDNAFCNVAKKSLSDPRIK